MKIAGFDRYDMINNPMDNSPSFTIWFGGCSLNCPDCQNPELQEADNWDNWSVKELTSMILDNYDRYNVQSVVFLGGEPLQQDQQELLLLCSALHSVGLKIWLYTGYDIDLVDNDLIQYLHMIKCGRYDRELAQDGFPASSNQKVYKVIAGELVDYTAELRR